VVGGFRPAWTATLLVATAVADRGAEATIAISPKTSSAPRVLITRPLMRSSISPDTMPYISLPVSPSRKTSGPALICMIC